jgi:hypothetical protein
MRAHADLYAVCALASPSRSFILGTESCVDRGVALDKDIKEIFHSFCQESKLGLPTSRRSLH